MRKESDVIKAKSLAPEVYECLNGVEKFIGSNSESYYSSQDIANLLEDKALVKKLPEYIYSYLLGKTVQAYNRSKLLSKNDVDVSGILMKGEDDEVVPLSESNMTSEDINELLQTNDNNSSLSNVSLKSFTQELGLEYKETESFRSQNGGLLRMPV